MSYALSFMAITATITHAIIHFRKPIKVHFKRSLQEQPDIHARLMANYRQGNQSISDFDYNSFTMILLQYLTGGMLVYSV